MSSIKVNLKYLKKMKQEFSAFEEVFNSHIEKIKKEHQKVLIQKMSQLISDIANNEDLNEVYLREKYLNIKEKEIKVKKEKTENLSEEDLLDHTFINEEQYFYENKENGNIFNCNSEIIGKYKNGEFVIS
jgi:hypothetical protein